MTPSLVGLLLLPELPALAGIVAGAVIGINWWRRGERVGPLIVAASALACAGFLATAAFVVVPVTVGGTFAPVAEVVVGSIVINVIIDGAIVLLLIAALVGRARASNS